MYQNLYIKIMGSEKSNVRTFLRKTQIEKKLCLFQKFQMITSGYLT